MRLATPHALIVAVLVLSVPACTSRPSNTATPATGARAQPAATAAAGGSSQAVPPLAKAPVIQISDLYHLSSVSDVRLTPDATRAAFEVQRRNRPGSPYSEIWTADLATRQLSRVAEGSAPRWSPDGRLLAYQGRVGSGPSGLVVSDGNRADLVAEVRGTNHPLPQIGARMAWSPDGRQIAFVSAADTSDPPMDADPIVITRYWYRPASSWPARFSDNRRLHLFVVDLASRKVRQLTDGPFSEHSIAWSPDGRQLAFLSNHEPDPDFFFNYDIFLLDVASGAVRQLTHTRSNEYAPVWSPDGKTIAYQGLERPVTSSETNSEDTHVWTVDVATGTRREVGPAVDNRQGRPAWSPDGRWLYFTLQSRGNVALYRLPAGGGQEERVLPAERDRGTVANFDVAADGVIAFAMTTPADLPQLFVRRGETDTRLTDLNQQVLAGRTLGAVESFTFKALDGLPIEAFLTKPAVLQPGGRHPLIVMIHGGPHGQQGPSFNHKAQAYAGRGWASLMVNYRGSTGYGQAFSDAIARDQNGREARDVLKALDEALSRYPWIDGARLGVEGGSYGGQLTNWLVTQTGRFKAAVPWASISNLVSHNYMSVYHDYLEQEYGGRPHTGGIVDMLWERSAIRLAHRVKTPVMFAHGDNDLLVNPAEIEQFYIALKDVGVETMMVRYPREGHGMRETGHMADLIERSIGWYERHFARARE